MNFSDGGGTQQSAGNKKSHSAVCGKYPVSHGWGYSSSALGLQGGPS